MSALMLAEAIADPALRFTSLQHVVTEWANDHRGGDVAQYVAALPNLDPAQRRSLIAAGVPRVDPDAASE